MNDRQVLEALFTKHSYGDFRWIDPKVIVVAQRVRVKCVFGCGEFGRNASCPPNAPSVLECQRFFDDYTTAVVFHFEKAVEAPEDRHEWTRGVNAGLVALEREVFLAGYQKVFLLFMDSCGLCKKCAGVREECRVPRSSRPTPESMAMDVFSTVRRICYPIQVLADYHQIMNRCAFLLIE
jgi:predicted metal-binding protein